MTRALPRLHAITDERVARRADLPEVARALAAGAPGLALHARGRALTGREHFELASRLAAEPSSRLFVNDRLDIALATAASGVQLGHGSLAVPDARRLGPEWLIGRSVHSVEEARAAQAAGADYLVVGPVYQTATHPDAPLVLAVLREITALGLPVIAIGGITVEKVAALRAVGVHGVAAIRALWDADRPEDAARAMARELA